MGDRMLSELRKTAAFIRQRPWGLERGAAYLEKLCDDNESRHLHRPPPLAKLTERICHSWGEAGPADLLNFAPGTPRQVTATFLKPREKEAQEEGEDLPQGHGRGRGRARGRGRGRGRGRSGGAERDAAESEEAACS